mmetsp:Transcript_66344/g.198188  ORF Transcript_66344/g.198188 Transcript_66344/m.198188 type:complete len:133 (+) Transcript_66344:400-798(+)
MFVQRNIIKKDIEYPDDMEADAASFIGGLLNREPAKRLGAGASGTADIKAAPFFAPVDFSAVEARQVVAQWVPPAGGVDNQNATDGEGDDLAGVPAIPFEADEELIEMTGDKEVTPDLFHGFSFVRGKQKSG